MRFTIIGSWRAEVLLKKLTSLDFLSKRCTAAKIPSWAPGHQRHARILQPGPAGRCLACRVRSRAPDEHSRAAGGHSRSARGRNPVPGDHIRQPGGRKPLVLSRLATLSLSLSLSVYLSRGHDSFRSRLTGTRIGHSWSLKGECP